MNKNQHIQALKAEKIKRQLEVLKGQPRDNDTLRLWFENGREDLGLALDEFEFPEHPCLLVRYMHDFWKIFFAGDQCVKNFEVRMVMAEGDFKEEWKSKYPTRWGETLVHRSRNGYIRVEINIFEAVQRADHQEQLEQYLSVLLHEMLHGFLDFEPCPCAECAKGPSLSARGLTGHGLPFMEVSEAMEQFCEEVLDLPLDLHRHQSMAYELREGGLSSKDVDLVALGLNEDLIDRPIQSESKDSGSQTSN
jgi:hypothetical protein